MASSDTRPVDDPQKSLRLSSLASLHPDAIQVEIWVHGTADHIPKVDQCSVHCLLLVSVGICEHQTGNGE